MLLGPSGFSGLGRVVGTEAVVRKILEGDIRNLCVIFL